MTAQNKATIKGYFNTGDIPTEGNFGDLVDSYADVVHSHGEADITDLEHAIPIYEDGGFLVTGTLINFENDIEVAVTGTFAHVSANQANWHVGARVYDAGNQTIPTAEITKVAFDSERYDTDTIHDNVTNNTRLTATTGGKYLVWGSVRFAANATGRRIMYILLNNTTTIARFLYEAGAVNAHPWQICTIYDLSATDYVELQVYQDSGGNLDIESEANVASEFAMQRIG